MTSAGIRRVDASPFFTMHKALSFLAALVTAAAAAPGDEKILSDVKVPKEFDVCVFSTPDMANYPVSVSTTARIGNGGAKQVPAGIRTAIYDGDPANGGLLIGSVLTTKTLNFGQGAVIMKVRKRGQTRGAETGSVTNGTYLSFFG